MLGDGSQVNACVQNGCFEQMWDGYGTLLYLCCLFNHLIKPIERLLDAKVLVWINGSGS